MPAFGGRELTRSARTTRPDVRVSSISASQAVCSASTRSARPTRSFSASSLVSSSRAAASAATTTERRSRRSISPMSAMAASALSRHSAVRRAGMSSSARASRGAGEISGLPSALLDSFCFSTAWRTAGMPPLSTCSATGFCSSGRPASTSLRWVRPARRRFGFGLGSGAGRGGRAGRSRRSPAGRSALSRRGARSRSPVGRPSRSPPGRPSRPPSRRGRRSLSRPPLPFGASWVVTSSSSRFGGPMISRRSGSLRAPLGVSTAVMTIPSIMKSASARTTSPTLAPS